MYTIDIVILDKCPHRNPKGKTGATYEVLFYYAVKKRITIFVIIGSTPKNYMSIGRITFPSPQLNLSLIGNPTQCEKVS